MENKEVVKNVLNQFFLIFTIIIITMLITIRLSGHYAIALNDVIGALIMSVLTAIAGIIVYSKKDPKRSETIVRSAIHLAVVMAICLTVATIFSWLSWNTPLEVLFYVALFLAVYLIISLIDYFQTKKLADDLNAKLHERYRSRD